jgi:hypothetical protein
MTMEPDLHVSFVLRVWLRTDDVTVQTADVASRNFAVMRRSTGIGPLHPTGSRQDAMLSRSKCGQGKML